MSDFIRVEGVRQMVRAARRGTDDELPKRLGQANRQVGQMIIARLFPKPDTSGAGAGASVRPSSSKDRVVLRVGGKHRSGGTKEQIKRRQWGRRYVPRANPRPYILGTALKHRDDIERWYRDGVVRAFRNVGFDVKKGG